MLTQIFDAGLTSQKKLAIGEPLTRHSEHKRGPLNFPGLAFTKGKDTGARSIRDCHLLIQVSLTIVKGMKRKVMQCPMRHDNEMSALQMLLDGRNQLVVQLLQVRLGGAQQLRSEALNVLRA